MPNWCSNELIIEGTYNQIKDVENYLPIESGYWDFNKIMPCPTELWETKAPSPPDIAEANTKKHGSADWWPSCNDNWGTKWSVHIQVNAHSSSRWVLVFDSAWGPPKGVLEHLFEKFPKIDFALYYHEGGIGFKGELIWKAGQLVRDECWDWEGWGYCGGNCVGDPDSGCDEYLADEEGYYTTPSRSPDNGELPLEKAESAGE